jgi:tetratricopeptide (TPR) repeat protein
MGKCYHSKAVLSILYLIPINTGKEKLYTFPVEKKFSPFIFIAISLLVSLSACVTNGNDPADAKLLLNQQLIAPSENREAMLAYYNGSMALEENKLSEAEDYFQKAIALDPLFVDAMDHLGIVYRRERQYKKAEGTYLKSIETNKNNAVPYIGLALVYRDQNRLKDAFALYQKTIDLFPQDPEPYYGIGELFRMIEDYSGSIENFNKAVEKYKALDSGLVYDAYYYLGLNYYDLDEYEEALTYLEYYHKAYPGNNKVSNLINEIKSSLARNKVQ